MGQVKIYGLRSNIDKNRKKISNAIHDAIVSIFEFPKNKRFHRFIKLDKEDFIYPDSRSANYLIIEITCISGRSNESKKTLLNKIFDNIYEEVGIAKNDVEITIIDIPIQNWGIRGFPGDELRLSYKINI